MTMPPLSWFSVSAGGVAFFCSFGFSVCGFVSCLGSVITGSVLAGFVSLSSAAIIDGSACVSSGSSGGSSSTVSITVLVGSITGVSVGFVCSLY